jgi:hypothetical protein
MVGASCWRASEGRRAASPLDPPPLHGEDLDAARGAPGARGRPTTRSEQPPTCPSYQVLGSQRPYVEEPNRYLDGPAGGFTRWV